MYLTRRRTPHLVVTASAAVDEAVTENPLEESNSSRSALTTTKKNYMNTLFRQGAFQGQTPKDAYLVKCDKETTTQDDINKGIVNIVVGFAPLKPAEFVVIKIQQLAGQIDV